MASKARKSNSNGDSVSNVCIPWDLVIDILSWLPVISLLRLKCVSKAWNTLINDSKFIQLHRNRSLEREANQPYLLLKDSSNTPPSFYSIHTLPIDGFINFTQLNFATKLNIDFPTLVGTCHGLFCFSNVSMNKLVLYNPFNASKKIITCESNYNHYSSSFGLAYDAKQNDFKVVHVSRQCDLSRQCDIKVYSLKNKYWEVIKGCFPFPRDIKGSKPKFLNNTLHWISNDLQWLPNEKLKISCFDVSDNRFYQLSFPPDYC